MAQTDSCARCGAVTELACAACRTPLCSPMECGSLFKDVLRDEYSNVRKLAMMCIDTAASARGAEHDSAAYLALNSSDAKQHLSAILASGVFGLAGLSSTTRIVTLSIMGALSDLLAQVCRATLNPRTVMVPGLFWNAQKVLGLTEQLSPAEAAGVAMVVGIVAHTCESYFVRDAGDAELISRDVHNFVVRAGDTEKLREDEREFDGMFARVNIIRDASRPQRAAAARALESMKGQQ